MRKSVTATLTAVLFLAACCVPVLIAEATLRFFAEQRYYVWPPNLSMTFEPSSEAMPGVHGLSRFIINESGIRGRPFSDQDRFRILTVGGSTTECLYLDQTEAWPYLLEQQLNDGAEPAGVWVGNVGKSGHTSDHHALQAEKLLDQYPHIDAVLVLVGVNDMLHVAKVPGYQPLTPDELAEAFSRAPGGWNLEEASYPFYKRTELWRALRKVRNTLFADAAPLVQDKVGDVLFQMRKNRENASSFRTTFPDLHEALATYRRNLDAIVDAGQKHGTKVILVTQPSLWADDVSPEAQRLLWLGRIGPYMADKQSEYFAPATLGRALNDYNNVLLDVCKTRSIDCFDLAAAMPKDPSLYYDDIHFNEAGARAVASLLAGHFREQKAATGGP
jgi:lysophospholipase L1-like esterase